MSDPVAERKEVPREEALESLRNRVAELEQKLIQKEEGAKAEGHHRDFSPLVLTILGAIGTGILAISNSFFQAKQAHELEQDKLRSTLILKAIEPTDPAERKKALVFYVEAGLLSDPEGKIGQIKAENIPQAPASQGVEVQRIGNSQIKSVGNAILFSSGLVIDAGGAPRAYHPDGHSGLDALPNAGQPGNWYGVVTDTGLPTGNPVIQGPTDPAPGYYVSFTALADSSKARTDPRRYVDSSTVPYIVIPARFAGGNGGKIGDLALVYYEKANKLVYCVVADIGPARKIGEGSIALANALGLPADPKRGLDVRLTYLVFPNSGAHWPMTNAEIRDKGEQLFNDWGGLDRLKTENSDHTAQ
jgi:Fungal chitosanase of glycosyl hydrolase group 75